MEQNKNSMGRSEREAIEYQSIQRSYVTNARRSGNDCTPSEEVEQLTDQVEGVPMKHLLEFDPRLESEELEAAMNGKKYKAILGNLCQWLYGLKSKDEFEYVSIGKINEEIARLRSNEFIN